jgi:hypothetical protein
MFLSVCEVNVCEWMGEWVDGGIRVTAYNVC